MNCRPVDVKEKNRQSSCCIHINVRARDMVCVGYSDNSNVSAQTHTTPRFRFFLFIFMKWEADNRNRQTEMKHNVFAVVVLFLAFFPWHSWITSELKTNETGAKYEVRSPNQLGIDVCVLNSWHISFSVQLESDSWESKFTKKKRQVFDLLAEWICLRIQFERYLQNSME